MLYEVITIMGNRVYIPAVTVVNKVDMADEYVLKKCKAEYPEAIYISANKGENLDAVKDLIYDALDFIRIYLKPQGESADMEEPLIVRNGVNVGDICDHRNNFV